MSDKDNTAFREVASHGRRDFLKTGVALAVTPFWLIAD